MSVFEEVDPVDTPLHVHEHEDELFYALEGEHVFRVGEREHRVGPGGLVFAPRGIPHAQRRVVPRAGRVLVVCTPGGLEGFFRELDAAARAGSLGPDAYARASAGYGITWLDTGGRAPGSRAAPRPPPRSPAAAARGRTSAGSTSAPRPRSGTRPGRARDGAARRSSPARAVERLADVRPAGEEALVLAGGDREGGDEEHAAGAGRIAVLLHRLVLAAVAGERRRRRRPPARARRSGTRRPGAARGAAAAPPAHAARNAASSAGATSKAVIRRRRHPSRWRRWRSKKRTSHARCGGPPRRGRPCRPPPYGIGAEVRDEPHLVVERVVAVITPLGERVRAAQMAAQRGQAVVLRERTVPREDPERLGEPSWSPGPAGCCPGARRRPGACRRRARRPPRRRRASARTRRRASGRGARRPAAGRAARARGGGPRSAPGSIPWRRSGRPRGPRRRRSRRRGRRRSRRRGGRRRRTT